MSTSIIPDTPTETHLAAPPDALAQVADDLAVETILLDVGEKECAASPTHMDLDHAVLARYPALGSSLTTPFRVVSSLLKIALFLFVGFLASAHIATFRYYQRLPTFCLSPGMEAYHDSKHCLPDLWPELRVSMLVKPGMKLLDGPPPIPLHWADFQSLYDLQHRMIGHMVNATVYDDYITLESISKEAFNKQSALYQFQMEFLRRDFMKERVLQASLYIGAGLGSAIAREYESTKAKLEDLVKRNQKAAQGVEKAMDKQPKTLAAHAMALLFPRFRTSIWSWETDIEVRWQYYNSLAFFSWKLYGSLMALSQLLPKLEAYEYNVNDMKDRLSKDPTTNTTAESSTTPRRIRLQKPVASTPEEDERFEAMKRTVIEGVSNAIQTATNRVSAALIALRSFNLAEELETMRHRVAEPGPYIPLQVHLRHIYVEGFKLREMLKRMK